MSKAFDEDVKTLAVITGVPAKEIRSLGPKRVRRILRALYYGLTGKWSDRKRFQAMEDNGWYDLPAVQEQLEREYKERKLARERAVADYTLMHRLRRGRFDYLTTIIEDRGAYPPVRMN